MAFIRTISPQEARGPVRELYERQQERLGYVPNHAKLFSHRPALMKYWSEMQDEIRRHIEPRRYELVNLVVAATLHNSAGSLEHGRELTDYYSEAEVKAIARGGSLDGLSDADQAMVAFVRKVAMDASLVTAGDFARLQVKGFSDTEIFDIVSIAAARAFITKLLDGLGSEADSIHLDLNESMRKALVVGRPIDYRRTETIAGETEGAEDEKTAIEGARR